MSVVEGGTAVPDMQSCMRMNRRVAVLRGVILGRRCSLQVRSQGKAAGMEGTERSAPVGEGRVQSVKRKC